MYPRVLTLDACALFVCYLVCILFYTVIFPCSLDIHFLVEYDKLRFLLRSRAPLLTLCGGDVLFIGVVYGRGFCVIGLLINV